MPTYTVKLFASARERAGKDSLSLSMEEGSSVSRLRAELDRVAPDLAPLLSRCAIAVNRKYAAADVVISSADEIAVIPPVAGG